MREKLAPPPDQIIALSQLRKNWSGDFLLEVSENLLKTLTELLTELTDRDVIKWEGVDANCFVYRIGIQTFSFCQWHEGLECCFSGLKLRDYDYGLFELRDAVDRQADRLAPRHRGEPLELPNPLTRNA